MEFTSWVNPLGVIIMKKILPIICVFCFITTSFVQALSWAFPFVVWKGNVYEVTDEVVHKEEIGKQIGEVKRMPNEMTGNYFGDASNAFSKGTKYFEIKAISSKEAIAVEAEEAEWVKAVFAHKAPFHWMDLITTLLPTITLIVIIIFIILRLRKGKRV